MLIYHRRRPESMPDSQRVACFGDIMDTENPCTALDGQQNGGYARGQALFDRSAGDTAEHRFAGNANQ